MKTAIIFLNLILCVTNAFSQSGWVFQNSNTNKTLTDVFFINEQKGWIVTDSSKILRTTDGGMTWEMQTLPFHSPLKTIFFINENTGWAAGGYYYFAHFGVIFKTTNGGLNWSSTYSPEIEDIYFINSSTGFAGYDGSWDFVSGGGILKTTNGGINWTGFQSDYIVYSITFKGSDTGFAVGKYWDDTSHDSSIVYRTIDGGNSWEIKYKEGNYQFHSSYLRDICIKGNKAWAAGRDSSMLYSSNNGENWSRQLFQKPRVMESIYFINEQTGWAAGVKYSDTTNLIKTTNGGMNWFNLKNNYSNRLYSVSFINENTGWSVGEAGIILKSTSGGLTFINNSATNILSSYILNQNFPNPFNPSTLISYQLPVRSNVMMKVFDNRGKEIQTLVNESKPAGNYEIQFNASDISSGIYYYSLYANEALIETRKMIVLK